MKPFWKDLFFDLDSGNMTQETAAIIAGNTIRSDLRKIQDAIQSHNGKLALEIIEKLKADY